MFTSSKYLQLPSDSLVWLLNTSNLNHSQFYKSLRFLKSPSQKPLKSIEGDLVVGSDGNLMCWGLELLSSPRSVFLLSYEGTSQKLPFIMEQSVHTFSTTKSHNDIFQKASDWQLNGRSVFDVIVSVCCGELEVL